MRGLDSYLWESMAKLIKKLYIRLNIITNLLITLTKGRYVLLVFNIFYIFSITKSGITINFY